MYHVFIIIVLVFRVFASSRVHFVFFVVLFVTILTNSMHFSGRVCDLNVVFFLQQAKLWFHRLVRIQSVY